MIARKYGLRLAMALFLGLVLCCSPALAGWGNGGPQGPNGGQGIGNCGDCVFTGGELTDQEAASVAYMLEEEKLARDVYAALADQWGAVVFSNISQSEQQHLDALANLASAYGLDNPTTGAGYGEFENQELATLYTTLVDQGSGSYQDALQVGATIEDLDIFDLDTYLGATSNQDLTRVMENLVSGSENHLRAFAGQLENYGVTYEAQYISADRLAQILGD